MIKGFKMKLYPGMEAEYEKRHNQLWPEMKDMIHEHGGKNYTIFLDRETLTLFGYIEIENEELWFRYATGTFPFGGESHPFIYLNNICFYTENRIFRIHRAIAFPVCLLWAEGKWESQKPVSNRIHVLLDTGFIKYLFI